MSESLQGRTALVTGAAGTMGLAATRFLLEDGCTVAMVDVNQARNRHRFWRRRHRADQISLDAHVAAHGDLLPGREAGPDRVLAQKELAQRIVAAPGSDAYGRLSVLAQWRSQPRIALEVPRQAFTPPPKITSAVVHVVPTEPPAGVRGPVLEALTAAAFGQRRKMLRASLRGLPGALDALEKCGVDSARRAETLSVAEFTQVAKLLS